MTWNQPLIETSATMEAEGQRLSCGRSRERWNQSRNVLCLGADVGRGNPGRDGKDGHESKAYDVSGIGRRCYGELAQRDSTGSREPGKFAESGYFAGRS